MLSPSFVEPEPASPPSAHRGPSVGRRRPVDRALLAVALVLASVLAGWNLEAQWLWQDEAQSALLARTTLEHGLPLGTDGRNFFSQELGAEYDANHRWRWHTWLHFYLVAGSFGLLGESTLAARLPAALLGVLTLWMAHALARAWWRRDPVVAHATSAALLLLVPFWILARQCRYYSLTAFCSTGLLLGYAWLVDESDARRRRRGAWLYGCFGVALFHAHYVYLPPLLAATALHAGLWQRARLLALLRVAALVLLLCSPWIVWQSGMDYGRNYATQFRDPQLWLANANWFIRSLLAHGSGLALLGAGVALAAVAAFPARRAEGFTGLGWLRDRGVACLGLAGLAMLVTVSVAAPGPFFRYLTPLLPLVAIGVGALAAAATRLHWLAGIAVLVAVGSLQPLAQFGHELGHEFEGPIEGLVGYLEANAEPTDTVWITYGDLPLKFYSNFRVLGGLTGENLGVALVEEPPDWVVVRHHIVHPDRDGLVADFIRNEIDLSEFRKVQLPLTDTTFENREEPAEHRFRSARGDPPVVLYRRARS